MGLVGMASQKLQDGIAELLGMEALRKGINVRSTGSRVEIDVYIVVGLRPENIRSGPECHGKDSLCGRTGCGH
ncbi:MAG: Asp23/Gls24 family envelope stress response protein [Bacillota bacterium]